MAQSSWMFPRDPDFHAKAARVLDLYEGRFEGRLLHPGELVICADEKTQLQALAREHSTLPPEPGRPMLVEHEYERHGTLAYLVALDIGRRWKGSRPPQLYGRCEQKVGIEPFGRLVEQVMTQEPYASARRVFWIVDDGSSHAGRASIERLEGEWENLRLIHLPCHASWLTRSSSTSRSSSARRSRQGLLLARGARRADHGLPGPLATGRRPLRLELHAARPRCHDGARGGA